MFNYCGQVKFHILFVLCMLCCAWTSHAAQNNDLPSQSDQQPVKAHDPKEDLGWHFYWYEEPEEEPKKEEKTKQPSPTPSKTDKAEPFSTKWFQQNFTLIQERAINQPTKSNMRALLYAERVMADKSEVFARRKQFVQSVDPFLQEGTRIPMAGTAKNALMIYKDEQRDEALQEISQHSGLAFFYDKSCQYCHRMIPVINLLKIQNNMEIRVFAKNAPDLYIPKLHPEIPVLPYEQYEQAFNISFWPALAMLRPPNDVYVVTQGSVTLQELTTRMINIAFDQNILNEDWFYRVYPEQKGLISPDQLNQLPVDMSDDPVKLINSVIDMIEMPQGTYDDKGVEE